MALEAKQGVDVILLYRLLKEETEKAAWKLAFQTEHEVGLSRDSNSSPTKDGAVQSLSQLEYDFSATSIAAKGDPHIKELKQALIKGELIEIWEIDKSEKGTAENSEKFAATYFQGYLSSFSQTANSEDAMELSLEFAINGVGQEGFATLTTDQAEVVQYVFKDTVKATP
ncbi:phage major tail protein, TP901-1 family [uncultured Vagococcus sp.]|uniref:phage major tail protein, TP901-1 family n=1 Tax=uncultured Vagococcus sp. TaxID=189676 RepID=UPI0028D049CC|nr:phage major tail protein, TP901-1 family [uncultured Vagococcus sp.]